MNTSAHSLANVQPDASIHWVELDEPQSARWICERGTPAPKRVVLADDTLSADSAYRLACAGTAMLWRGDFNNARQLVLAMARRIDKAATPSRAKVAKRARAEKTDDAPGAAFNRHRMAQGQRARLLSMVLIQLDANHSVKLRRAPDVVLAVKEAWGDGKSGNGASDTVMALRELLGLVGAHEWRKKGVEVAALGGEPLARIHPHYGVFSPLRGEYLAMIAAEPLPKALSVKGARAFDVGTGTGVIAVLLARRGVHAVVATDNDARALTCAQSNVARLGAAKQVQVVDADLYPPGRAALIVCNPPWLPARPGSAIERAVYDEGGGMLSGFLSGLAAHLDVGGEGWLILSDLAEHLGLRTRQSLLGAIKAAGLVVLGRKDARPTHAKVNDDADPLHAARAAEVTSLWRLGGAE